MPDGKAYNGNERHRCNSGLKKKRLFHLFVMTSFLCENPGLTQLFFYRTEPEDRY